MSFTKGRLAEQFACQYLIARGYCILAQNFSCRFGEIDIIALYDHVLHFIEVKSRKDTDPVYAITPSKLEKIKKSIGVYLQQSQVNYDFCIDAITLKGTPPHCQIEWIENITL
ncbi:YraN family protein [Helicobacter suis]|uniref:YraN family protein n=1 Tax=Helicobacter suis TaxID=104628 RepID=UPI000CF0CD37|nr:YraN family protein [Helicobacter suis]